MKVWKRREEREVKDEENYNSKREEKDKDMKRILDSGIACL